MKKDETKWKVPKETIVCPAATVCSVTPPETHNFEGSWKCKLDRKTKEVSCKARCANKVPVDGVITCTEDGGWSEMPTLSCEEEEKVCTLPPPDTHNFDDGTWVCKSTRKGIKCAAQCTNDVDVQGEITCTEAAGWSPKPLDLSCEEQEKVCTLPPPDSHNFENGDWRCKESKKGTKCTAVCNIDGDTFDIKGQISCSEREGWSEKPDDLQCVRPCDDTTNQFMFVDIGLSIGPVEILVPNGAWECTVDSRGKTKVCKFRCDNGDVVFTTQCKFSKTRVSTNK